MKRMSAIGCLLFVYFFCHSQPRLYVSTSRNGDNYLGSIIEYSPGSGVSILRAFQNQNKEGFSSRGGLLLASDGKLYGMTDEGGLWNYGVIFSLDPVTATYKKLIDFNGENGKYPSSNRLIEGQDGKFYGTTPYGGIQGLGVLFSFDPRSGIFTKIRDFNLSTGGSPYGGLVEASDGKFYGTCFQGGSLGYGTIFCYDPLRSGYEKKRDFDFVDGAQPYADNSLIQASDGKLYGMTLLGGAAGWGVLYSFDPRSSVYIKLKDFNEKDGNFPYGRLYQAGDGLLWGNTYYGGKFDAGVIFTFNPASRVYTVIKDLNKNDGTNPAGSLMQASDGKFYGLAKTGGTADRGVIFSIDPLTKAFVKEVDLSASGPNAPLYTDFIEVSPCSAKTDSTTEVVCVAQIPYSWNNFLLEKEGIYRTKLKTPSGCDSTIILNLRIDSVPSPVVSVTQPACGQTKGSVKITTSIMDPRFSINGDDFSNTSGLFDDLTPGSYSVFVKNASGCLSSKVEITIDAPKDTPPLPSVAGTVTYCQHAQTSALTAVPMDGYTLRWYTAASGVNGTDMAPIPSSDVYGEKRYYVSQLNANGCESEKAEIKVLILPAPVAALEITADCEGVNEIKAVSGSGPATDYIFTWKVPTGAVNPGNTTRFITTSPGLYSVTLTDKKTGCASEPASGNSIAAFVVEFPDVKVLDTGVVQNTVYIGYEPARTVTIAPIVSGGHIPYRYQWSTGATDSSISVTPGKATVYTVTVTNAAGCTQTVSKEIKVIDVTCDNKVRICRSKGNQGFESDCMPYGSVADQLLKGGYLGECRTGGRYAPDGVNLSDHSSLQVMASPNPSTSYFSLELQSNSQEPVQIVVRDQIGKIIEIRKVASNNIIKVGGHYRPGIYYAEIIQGPVKASTRLVKQ